MTDKKQTQLTKQIDESGLCIFAPAANELRIDAAGVEKVKRNGESAAASVLVELSRIWKKKPGGTVKKSQKEVHPTNKERSGKYFT